MKDIETRATMRKLVEDRGSSTTVKQSWFCVAALSPDGIIFKTEAESPASFLEKLWDVTIGWVDYVTQDADFDKEALGAAAQLGFSNELVSFFIGQSYLNYQDLDIEMGMKVPCVQVGQLEVEARPLLLLLRKTLILTIHPANVDRRFIRLRRYA